MIFLFIFILPLSDAGGFNWPLVSMWPTAADIDEANQLTKWITNKSLRYMLTDYLVLCPQQNMCLGSSFRRNFTFTENPACPPCECDDACVRKSTCCPSKFFRQTDTPDFIEYPHNAVDMEKEAPLKCIEPLWNQKGVKVNKLYWMVLTCPKNVACLPSPSSNLSDSTPVTSLATNLTYHNVHCALCNQEKIHNLVAWEMKKICTLRTALLSREDTETLYQSAFSASPICNIGFYPPKSTEHLVEQCFEYTHNAKCDDAKNKKSEQRAYLTKACEEYYLPYYSFRKFFKNVFCALCEHEIVALQIQYIHGDTFGDIEIAPFTALMNSQQVKNTETTHSKRCKGKQIFDEKLNTCLEIQCEAEYVYHNLACHPIHKMLQEMNYEINIVLSYADNVEIENVTPNVISSLQQLLQLYNLTDYLCRMTALLPSETNEDYLAVVMELSINYLHDVDQKIKYFIDVFNDHKKLEVNIPLTEDKVFMTLSLVGQRFHIYGNGLFEKLTNGRLFINPNSGNEMIVSKIVDMVNGNFDPQRPYCLKGNMMSTVAEWYRCPKAKIMSKEARIDVYNFTACLVDYDSCFASHYYKESLDRRSVAICLDKYYQAVKTSSRFVRAVDDKLMATLSLVCLSLSSLGSLATICAFLISRSCHRIADVNIIILAVFLILANTSHLVSKSFVWSQTLCIGIGIIVHFCWLSVVCWMSLSSFQIFQTFTSFNKTTVNVVHRVLFCLLINMLICLSLVGVNVLLSYVRSNGKSIGYSLLTCYIADSYMILYTFTLPVGLLVCINCFMLAVTVCRISKRTNVQKSKDENKTGAYFRLSTITGATWVFGFLSQFTGIQLFAILHTLFNGGQGVFLYLAFGVSLIRIKFITFSQRASDTSKTSATN